MLTYSVIDTKFIATCDTETATYGSNLQGIWDLLSTQDYPAIRISDHPQPVPGIF